MPLHSRWPPKPLAALVIRDIVRQMISRPARVPDYPPLVDRIAADIDGKIASVQFVSTRKQARAILDEIDRQAKENEAKTEKK